MKMSPLRLSLALALALAAAGMSGCNSGQAEPPKGHVTPQVVAVARGSIDVEGGLLQLSAAVPGILDQVDAHVGDHVHKGQKLASLASDNARAAVTVARGQLAQARAQAQLIARQLKAARDNAHTLAEAADAGADARQNATDAANHAAELADREASATAAVTVARGQLAQASHALDMHIVRAPLDALVNQVLVQPGESVSAQSGPLFTLLPDAPRIVNAEINSDYVTRIHPGMRAEVVLDNDSEQVVGTAHVTVVGQVFGPSTLEADPSVRANTRTVKCQLRFDQPHALRIGQRVLVRFLPDADAKH